jgi:uncharacterized iron-regulated protein
MKVVCAARTMQVLSVRAPHPTEVSKSFTIYTERRTDTIIQQLTAHKPSESRVSAIPTILASDKENRMKKINIFSLAVLLVLSCLVSQGFSHPHILDLAEGRETSFAELIDDLLPTQVVFIGEVHDHPGHHQAQLAVIEALHQAGREVVIGLEMFQHGDQEVLDDWVSGRISREEFVEVYHRNWQWWPLYQPIFEFAREQGIELLGLNVPREITAQVAREGFDSLTPEQMQEIGFVSCRIGPEYEQFIRRAMGVHAHGDFDFQHFCEAQLVWDSAMARRISEYLDEHPQATVVVLAGNGHAWRYGIPDQLGLPAEKYAVILPETPGRADREDASLNDGDYLWLDFGPDSWQP